MRQVPEIAIIGAGRVARHFAYYFDLIYLPYLQWSRTHDPQALQLPELLANAKSILILIKDSAIEPFIQKHQTLFKNKILIHFSGHLVTPLAYGAHPLMTFNNESYDLATYQKIPFILDDGIPALNKLIPELTNPYYYLNKNQKAFYHSLCVMSGNFTCLLWQKFIIELENNLKLPSEIINPYLEQIFYNLRNQPQMALTGPLARNDQTTINANLKALEHDDFLPVYRAFIAAYSKQG